MTVYELIQALSRFDSDTPVYIVPVDNVNAGVCRVSDVEPNRSADSQAEIALIYGDEDKRTETMADIYDRIEHGEYERGPKIKPCTCGSTPEILYNLFTGKHGVLCRGCGKWEPDVYFSEKDAIKIWNDMITLEVEHDKQRKDSTHEHYCAGKAAT